METIGMPTITPTRTVERHPDITQGEVEEMFRDAGDLVVDEDVVRFATYYLKYGVAKKAASLITKSKSPRYHEVLGSRYLEKMRKYKLFLHILGLGWSELLATVKELKEGNKKKYADILLKLNKEGNDSRAININGDSPIQINIVAPPESPQKCPLCEINPLSPKEE